jgi:hypothetical protein
MEVHHDLRKFITELAVAQRRHVLSSGREACGATDLVAMTVQGGTVSAAQSASTGAVVERVIINVGQLTLGAETESSTAMGSDLWAAEALQEAETEVGAAVMIDRGADVAVRVPGRRTDRLTRRPISALRPES